MKTIDLRAGERVRVLHRFSSSIPQTFTFGVEPLEGTMVSGTVEVCGSRWLRRTDPVVLPLAATVVVNKGFWDTIWEVFVTPDQDVQVTVHRGRPA